MIPSLAKTKKSGSERAMPGTVSTSNVVEISDHSV